MIRGIIRTIFTKKLSGNRSCFKIFEFPRGKVYTVNELELLGVVWAIEHNKYYLYGKHFTVITDHQALISALNASKRSKTSQSRLTRWFDRLIPFNFDIKNLAGN